MENIFVQIILFLICIIAILIFYVREKLKKNKIIDVDKNGDFITYHDSAKKHIKSIESYKNGKLNGLNKELDLDGSELLIKEYKEGIPSGIFRKFFMNGKIEVSGQYLDGKQNGEWRIYFSENKIKKIKTYLDGELHGEQFEYFENGNLDKYFVCNKGKYDGVFKTFFENGNLKYCSTPIEDNDRKFGFDHLHENFNISGILMSKGIMDKDQKKKGIWTEYFENGKIKFIFDYGRENVNDNYGEWIEYHENGNLKKQGVYFEADKTKSTGLWKEYHSNGNLYSIGNYNHLLGSHVKIGEWNVYFDNGTIEKDYEFSDKGKRTGVWKNNYETGGVRLIRRFNNKGEFIGLWEMYYETGELKGRCNYDDKIKITYLISIDFLNKWEFYFKNGNLKSIVYFGIGMWDNYTIEGGGIGDRYGFYQEYHENKKIKCEGNILKNKKIDVWKYYNNNGILEFEKNMNNKSDDEFIIEE